jgi:hypothetical protein
MGVALQRGPTKNEDGSLLVKGFFTSDQRDEVGDIITRNATVNAVPKYRQWGNIRYMHMNRPVGKVVRIGEDDGLAWNEVEIKVIDPQAIFEVEQGLLTALSVGILINLDDIDFLEDGGWVINEYLLAEISLVDHPANYDARLLELAMQTKGLRSIAREMGLEALARSLESDAIIEGEKKMPKLKGKEVLAEEEVPAEEEAAEEEVPAEEEAVEEEVPAEEEEVPAGAEEEEEAGEEEEAAPVEEEDFAEVAEKLRTSFAKAIEGFEKAMTEFAERIEKVMAPLETPAEVPVAEEQPEGEGEEDDQIKQLAAQVDALQKEIDELKAPANRPGYVPSDPIMEEEEDKDKNLDDDEDDGKPTSLRDAIKRHMGPRYAG